jgi:putative thioredoxin
MSSNDSHVIDVTQDTFERDVIERSKDVPVVVDFWAEWCPPCRILGPVLERLAGEYGGKFILAKADAEKNAGAAADFVVRSIPAVFGLRDGKVVDGFVGALSEAAIRAWLDRLLPTPAEVLVAEAKKLEDRDPHAAQAKYEAALALSPNGSAPKIGLARVAFAQGRADDARSILQDLERRGFLEPDAEKLKAELTLHSQAQNAETVDSARAAALAHRGDLSLQLRLAETLASSGQYAEALEICLRLVEADRRGVGESARKTMLAIFQLLPGDSELAGDYRRQLSLVL